MARKFGGPRKLFKKVALPTGFKMPKPGQLRPSKPLPGQPWLPFPELLRKREESEEAKS